MIEEASYRVWHKGEQLLQLTCAPKASESKTVGHRCTFYLGDKSDDCLSPVQGQKCLGNGCINDGPYKLNPLGWD